MRPVLKIVLPILVLALGGGGLAAFIHFQPDSERQPIEPTYPVVTIVTAAPATLQVDAFSQGHARPEAVTTVSSEVMGVVISVDPGLQDGARVTEGQELLRIDDADYRAALASAEAQLAQLQSQ